MAAPLPPAAATAATRSGPSVTAAAFGTRREPLLRLRNLERRGPLGRPRLRNPHRGRLPQCLMPWTPGSQVDMAAGFEDLVSLEALVAAPGSQASGS